MNEAIFAAAGGRKTQLIVDRCSMNGPARRLVITYTIRGQEVLRSRFWEYLPSTNHPDILGWYTFLLKHIVRPYVKDLYKEQEVRGLNFVEGGKQKYKEGSKQFFDNNSKVYSNTLSLLAVRVIAASNGSVIDRLENIYDEIYIDEVQDLTGNDLDILESLLKSNIKLTVVGDVRQSIIKTSKSDTKHRDYSGPHKILWFKQKEGKGLCRVTEVNETWRCNQQIIDFADSVFSRSFGFPSTTSHQKKVTGHDGVFVVSKNNLAEYIRIFEPKCYRHSIRTAILPGCRVINFGKCKGETVPRVLIFPTDPIKKFLAGKFSLADKSAAELYVASTRAVHSVAFVVENPSSFDFPEWTP